MEMTVYSGREMESRREDPRAMKALVAAVLERACDDLKIGGRLAVEATDWLTEGDPADAWSFEWCCAILDLDPEAVRQQLAGGWDSMSAA
jgi:hypothetical protein